MILTVHLPGARCYQIGDEIWQQSLADAITAEAEMIAEYAPAQLPTSRDQAHRRALRERIIREMTCALVSAGDQYQVPDGVRYSLIDDPAPDGDVSDGRLTAVSSRASEQIVEAVVRFENLPLGSVGTRSAIVRWSDGTTSAAITWYADEVLSPVDHVVRQ
jgi:hypothetical protein